MLKTINRLILFLFFAIIVTIIFMVSGLFSDKSSIEKYAMEAKTHSILIGRFIEHIIDERRERLEIASSITHQGLRHRSLVEYTDFIREHYDLQGGFAVGEIDSNYKIISNMDFSSGDINVEYSLSGDARQKLSSGVPYIGTLPSENGTSGEKLLLAFPILNDGKFIGAVYDIFVINDNKVNVSLWQSSLTGGLVVLLSDSIPFGSSDKNTAELYELRNSALNNIIRNGNRMVGFYKFKIKDTTFTLIYQTANIKSILNFSSFPWLEPYTDLILLSPLILLFVFAILELTRLNRKLENQVQERTTNMQILKSRYESLFQTIPEYVVLYSKDGTVIEYNKKCEEIFANTKFLNIYGFIKDSNKFRRQAEELNTGIVEKMGEHVLITSNGKNISVSVSSASINTEKGHSVISAFTDLTEYKGIQNNFYMAQRREAVGTLAAGMAHDFGNILQNIALQYNLAERAEDDEKKEKHLNSINDIVEGARKYLDGVLKYTKSTETTSEIVKGNMLTRTALDISGHILPAEVKIDYRDESENMMIKMNESRYIQLIVNLCQNACEAMNKRGTISVSTSIEEKQFGFFFCLRVKDTGKGIEQSELKNIFKPFYTTKNGKGTGLGLATVKQVVMDSGGMIDVKSTVGEGCEFIILIPESK